MMNMKALQMLDHVCHPIARLFITLLQIVVCMELFMNWHPDSRNDVYPHDIFWFVIAEGLWVMFWSICLIQLQSLILRICLGISAGLFLLAFAPGFLVIIATLFFMSHDTQFDVVTTIAFAIIILTAITALLGFSSMLWISIRPPQISKPSAPGSFHNQSVPQSC
jgi:hypothetical protein